jgi:transaldolase/glucose-6-phosphate isomerase
MGDQIRQLTAVGQSIWLDNIRRGMFASGELQRLLDSGLRGMTSNPTIFEKAIGAGNDYDEQLKGLIGIETDPNVLFEKLAVQDIRSACDAFRPLFDETHGADGYVSLEVSPTLAHDAEGTIASAKRLHDAVDRPNVMIKIPGTPECVPAIRATIAAGISVNVTLLFSVDRYQAAAEAYIQGLEDRIAAGKPVDKIASVASVFVSRIDSSIDKMLGDLIDSKGEKQLDTLRGKAGIANLKLTYQKFLELFHGERFAKAEAAGAHVMRPLWASTGTKNPTYSDLMYIESVVGKETVNTVPPATLEALVDHGTVRADTILDDLPGAYATMDALKAANISFYDVTEKLLADGVKSFGESYQALLDAITYKQKQLSQNTQERVMLALGANQSAVDATVAKLADETFLTKLWRKDAEPWSGDPKHVAIIKNALGWLDIAQKTQSQVSDLTAFATEAAKEFTHVVVLGMGGSSLAPDVLRATFGKIDGYPQLHVLDSTDPLQVHAMDEALDIAKTLFIVSSKSGTTTEPDAFFRHYYERVQKALGANAAGSHFCAVTDPDTKLDKEAHAMGFRRVFSGAPDIGGRYSALSAFGMVPAAIAGYPIGAILDRARGAMHANDATLAESASPAVRFGAAIGTMGKAGRDKLTIVTHPTVNAFGTWAEQLVAESTGKSGTGIVPIESEPLGTPEQYGHDRMFAYVGAGLPDANADDEAKLQALEAAGFPVIRLAMNDALDIGEQFFTWEVATATAGAVLGIDAFDQPNVQESKDNTVRILAEYAASGKGTFPEPKAVVATDDVHVIPLAGSAHDALGDSLQSAIAALVQQIGTGDYVAFTVYAEMNAEHEAVFHDLRTTVRNAKHVATTVGFGPRFLHSTGQLHKGGSNEGVFFQITHDAAVDVPIPGMVSFRTLERAQALGDFESLDSRARRGARLHFPGDLGRGLRMLTEAFDAALAARA